MAGVSLTVGKDRGPYDNKTPAALCPFNTNFLALEEQVLFFILKGDIMLTNQTNARQRCKITPRRCPIITGRSFY